MARKKILLIGGSLNQTTMAHAVGKHLADDYDTYYTPYYCSGWLKVAQHLGMLDWTVIGGRFRAQTEAYMAEQGLQVDYAGKRHGDDYDLVITTNDLLVQENIRGKPILMVQEGMTDPENLFFHLVKRFGLPRYLGSTSTVGLSDAYDVFAVASEGYRDLFIRKGARPEKIVVTGIPNFDNMAAFAEQPFEHEHFVLVATSDARETKKFDDRPAFLKRCVEIADGRQLIFKLHPNEERKRAIDEIKAAAPDALIYTEGSVEVMIGHCDVLITQYSTVSYVGLALGKDTYSYFDIEELRRLMPMQNGGTSGYVISQLARFMLGERDIELPVAPPPYYLNKIGETTPTERVPELA